MVYDVIVCCMEEKLCPKDLGRLLFQNTGFQMRHTHCVV